jgi:signal transduction histidine kinase
LTSIIGYVELAQEEELPGDVRSHLQVVSRNGERLLALVNDLLFVARLQAGELALDQDDVELDGIVRETVEALEPRASAKDIALTCALDSVPQTHVDRRRLLQLLDNLLSNAVKFTPAGGSVHVALGRENGAVVLEVTDTGIGIAPGDQRLLFERFFRADNAVERQVPGTGLGLYISRVIAEAHDGSLTVRSELGQGSTFRLELPLVPAAVPA